MPRTPCTLKGMTTETPHLIDQSFIRHPLLNILLLSRVPTRDEIEQVLAATFGPRLGEKKNTEHAVAVELDDHYLVHAMVLDAPPQDPQTTYELHPVLTEDPSGLEKVSAQIMLSILPDNEWTAKAKQFREPRLHEIMLHAQATAALAALEGVEAIHNTVGDVTISPRVFVEAVTNNDPAMFSTSVWLTQGERGITAYTVGMVCAGHPEIMAVDSTQDPTKLFYSMLNVVNYALLVDALKDGDTFAFEPDAEPLSITAGPYISDPTIPAVHVPL
ncbi:DUF4261 domain-containing protein [Corynebacterium sp. 320]|nr:DUF4261 domain-containing protein [Corynebacterium sp. 320]KAB1552993.1 DUF4261 domain-containing protein [Corynebacterium sp. 321]KAB1553787.1 DUF4261 domain-containing protein [Corynebacterium sp. 319]KAB3528044.1 DUF4261 domain-containing protein [Corynebacterium sp. 250]KAB3540467.1 DUF4261 domain-containing protein [Corynebacterium sp. 366]